jgi:hypothetical protein
LQLLLLAVPIFIAVRRFATPRRAAAEMSLMN